MNPVYNVRGFNADDSTEPMMIEDHRYGSRSNLRAGSKGMIRKKVRPGTQIEDGHERKVLRSKKRTMTGLTPKTRKKSNHTSSSQTSGSRSKKSVKSGSRKATKSKTSFSKRRLKKPPTVKGSQMLDS